MPGLNDMNNASIFEDEVRARVERELKERNKEAALNLFNTFASNMDAVKNTNERLITAIEQLTEQLDEQTDIQVDTYNLLNKMDMVFNVIINGIEREPSANLKDILTEAAKTIRIEMEKALREDEDEARNDDDE
jgi:hypothetical protein